MRNIMLVLIVIQAKKGPLRFKLGRGLGCPQQELARSEAKGNRPGNLLNRELIPINREHTENSS